MATSKITIYNTTSASITVGSVTIAKSSSGTATYTVGYSVKITSNGGRYITSGGASSYTIKWPSSGTITVVEYSKLTYQAGTGGSISCSYSSGTLLAYGTSVKLTANANTNYSFSNWSGSKSGSSNPLTFTIGYDDLNITANFSYTPTYYYYLRFSANGGSGAPGTLSGSSKASYYNFTIPSTKPTRDDYTFLGWSFSSSATTADYTEGDNIQLTSGNADRTLYAVWSYTPTYYYYLRFDANGGSGGPSTLSGSSKASYYNFTIPTGYDPTRSNYYFQGWSFDSSATTADYKDGDNIQLVSSNPDRTLYAVWKIIEPITYTLHFKANGGENPPSDLSGSSTASYYNFTIPAKHYDPDRTHYDFLGWSFDKSATEPTYTHGDTVVLYATENERTLYAVWEEHPLYTLNFHIVPEDSGYVWHGGIKITTITAYKDDEYSSVGVQFVPNDPLYWSFWYSINDATGYVGTNDSPRIMLEGDTTQNIDVYFKQDTYDIIFNVTPSESGNVTVYRHDPIEGDIKLGSGTSVHTTLEEGAYIYLHFRKASLNDWTFIGFQHSNDNIGLIPRDELEYRENEYIYKFYVTARYAGTFTATCFEHTSNINELNGVPKLKDSDGNLSINYDCGIFNMACYDFNELIDSKDKTYTWYVPYPTEGYEIDRYTYEMTAVSKDENVYEFVEWEDIYAERDNPTRTGYSNAYDERGIKFNAIFKYVDKYVTITVKSNAWYGRVRIDDGEWTPSEVSIQVKVGDTFTIDAESSDIEKYWFQYWNDMSKECPRTFIATEDATYTAYFSTIHVLNIVDIISYYVCCIKQHPKLEKLTTTAINTIIFKKLK